MSAAVKDRSSHQRQAMWRGGAKAGFHDAAVLAILRWANQRLGLFPLEVHLEGCKSLVLARRQSLSFLTTWHSC